MINKLNKYTLPVIKECLLSVSSDPETHVGDDEYAIDFEVPEGSKVLAAASGEVIFVKTDSSQGGDDEKYEYFKYYNHIVIKHSDGEYSEYGHLQFAKSPMVKVGQKVRRGDFIAYSGNTGYSEKPHLHFSVFVLKEMNNNFHRLPKGKEYFINDSDFGFQTIEVDLGDY